MRLRRAVPKIPAKSSVPLGLPLNKSRSVPTRSESTLPHLLIPLHFKSRISNTYKKPQGEGPTCNPEVLQLVTIPSFTPSFEGLLLHTRRNSRNPNPLYALLHNFGTPRGWGHASQRDSHPRLSLLGISRVTEHGSQVTTPPVPLRRNPQSARITAVTARWPPGNKSAPGGV